MDQNRTKLLKHAAKELYHWSKLIHPNVLPLMGLAIFRGHIAMVSKWMEYGNLSNYLDKNPSTNRIDLANVMISSEGVAMIADFGNAHLRELTLKFTNTASRGFSLRWAAPELFSEDEQACVANMKSDVYAYDD
ncbi:hypothetical protein BN14_09704 [Rhizoctonia solani AG-1 IB]|uniref:Protein kinase domain-containing protein n=1 Tax=Thanatephorus cucumeris (strain AG1-IB / isolate 7/3/14) TaxID=1108050 RepID=M5C819_THACB|nr:hypothetical protein BN14_09704 [Rhizoctonia solani AG-1 IB]